MLVATPGLLNDVQVYSEALTTKSIIGVACDVLHNMVPVRIVPLLAHHLTVRQTWRVDRELCNEVLV